MKVKKVDASKEQLDKCIEHVKVKKVDASKEPNPSSISKSQFKDDSTTFENEMWKKDGKLRGIKGILP